MLSNFCQNSNSLLAVCRIVNTNDEAPVFVRRSYEREVLENVRPGVLLVQVEARDSDQPVQSNITYVLPHSYQHGEYFQLNHRNGELQLAKQLDREQIEHFYVPIYAFDEDFLHYALTLVHVKVKQSLHMAYLVCTNVSLHSFIGS